MTDNRTTELLHKLLDERGVKWWEGEDEHKTHYVANGLTWEYFNNENGDAWLGFLGVCESDVSPEQAIAATLGNRPTKSGRGYYTDRDGGGTHIMCDDCGGYIGTAEEIAATLGSGTCEACAFSKPTDLTDGCAALERIAELEEECDQLRKAVAYWQRMYEEQIGVRR